MCLVHIRLDFKDEGGKAVVEGVNRLTLCNSGQRRGCHLKEMLKEGLNAEIIESRAEEHRRQLTVAHGVKVEVVGRAVYKLYLLNQLLAHILANKLA